VSSQWHGGKGSSRRKDSDDKKYADGWERIFNNNKQEFWDHLCKHNGLLLIGKGEECSWCGEKES